MGDSLNETHFTERMEPDRAHPRTFWEHVGRYRFARDFVRGKRVLDIACGEGYGASALGKAGAISVVGVDVSHEVCEHARLKYGLDARQGDARAIPLPDGSVDLVVSFETIEHVDDPGRFIDECARVLAFDGAMVVSTPNRPVYTGDGVPNPYHRFEFDEDEFRTLLLGRFREVRLYTQSPRTAAWWSVRSLCAERSPWLQIKGFWRVSSWFCPAIRDRLDPALRESPDRPILSREPFFSALFNPFIVRPRSALSGERPYILVAVARGVIPG